MNDLMYGNKLSSWADLQKEFGLPRGEFLCKYMQIRSLF